MTIVLVHSDRRTCRALQRLLGAAGHRVEVTAGADGALELLEALGPALLVVDGGVGRSALLAVHAAARARGAEVCVMLLGPAGAADAPAIVSLGAVTSLLAQPLPALAESLAIGARKLARGDLFGAEKYLLWGTELCALELARSRDRGARVDELADRLRGRGQSARTASMAMLIADELLSNAIYNAPVDARGAPLRRAQPRDRDFPLDGRQRVRLRWGCDARYLAIEVTDWFGSLERDAIPPALARRDVRETGGGAGMGLGLAYRACDHLVFNLAPGARTEVIALLDVRAGVAPATAAPTYPAAASYSVFVQRAAPAVASPAAP